MHNSTGFDRLIRCIVIHSAKSAVHLSNNHGQVWANDLGKWRYQLFAHGDDFLSSLDNFLIKSDQKSTIHTLNCKHFPAPASNELPILQISGLLLNTSTTCCFCLLWKVLQLCGKQCQPTWGPFLESSILFGSISDATTPALSSKWPHFISNRHILR